MKLGRVPDFTKFQPIIVLQQLQSHQHSSPWNVFPSALLKLHFLVIISVISKKTPPESSKLPWFPSAGSQNGAEEWELQEFPGILEEYLQNTGQQRAGVGGQRGWGASASQVWASPPLPGALQTQSQGPRTPGKGKINSEMRNGVFPRPSLWSFPGCAHQGWLEREIPGVRILP